MNMPFVEKYLMFWVLVIPLCQALVEWVGSKKMRERLHRLFGLISLGGLLGVWVIFKAMSKGDASQTLPFSFNVYSFQFIITDLSLFFWSAKSILVFLIERFSFLYLFREPGIGKFYFFVSLFSFSLNLVFFSDSFTPFTLGWELMGLASVMLIAFYDHRRATVERSFLTFLFYKLGDFFLLTAILYIAHTTSAQSFSDLKGLLAFTGGAWVLCLFILACFVKSGLFPFSFWLPRSMEGPTPSSALFYGALSSHAGVFLLLRLSFNLEGMEGIPFVIMIFTGIVSALFAYIMALTRTDIKSQIVYSTLCQISVMFIEIALGWLNLALIHCIFHMFFRLFQFLIAPSAIYLSHEKEFLTFQEHRTANSMTDFQKKWRHWVWWLSFHEFGLAIFWRRVALEPLLVAGQVFKRSYRVLLHGFFRIYFLFYRPLNSKQKDWARLIFFLMICLLPVMSWSYAIISILGVYVCQILAFGFSIMSIQEKKLSSSFFNLIFSGTFLVNSYYYAVSPEHIHTFYAHLFVTTMSFFTLGGLFIFFRNAFDLPDGRDFFGLHRVSPFLSIVFASIILFILGFPGFSTYFSFELLSTDLSRISIAATITGLAI